LVYDVDGFLAYERERLHRATEDCVLPWCQTCCRRAHGFAARSFKAPARSKRARKASS
jgi:hypothetical protein